MFTRLDSNLTHPGSVIVLYNDSSHRDLTHHRGHVFASKGANTVEIRSRETFDPRSAKIATLLKSLKSAAITDARFTSGSILIRTKVDYVKVAHYLFPTLRAVSHGQSGDVVEIAPAGGEAYGFTYLATFTLGTGLPFARNIGAR